MKNYCISVKKKGEDIIFLRKIIRGGADESYGIEVAKLAGVPQLVIEKAKSILVELESSDINKKGRKKKSIKPIDGQLDFMSVSSFNKEEREILDTLRTMEVSSLTPLDALNKLYMFQQRLRITSYNVCYTKLLRILYPQTVGEGIVTAKYNGKIAKINISSLSSPVRLELSVKNIKLDINNSKQIMVVGANRFGYTAPINSRA